MHVLVGMPTHLDQHLPYREERDPIATASRRGVSPFVIAVVIALIAAFVWILVRG